MRRPLMLICTAFVAAVFIYLHISPLPFASVNEAEGSRVTYLGKVYHKEYKNDTLLLYLKEVTSVPEEKLLCYVAKGKEPKLGSIVMVEGQQQDFMEARNPGGFDQRMYYAIQGIFWQLKDTNIINESMEYSRYREGLYYLRRKLEYIFDLTLEEKDASVMKAMLLGNKAELDRDSKQLYQKSGIAHVLAISGLHISFLGAGLYKLLKKIRVPRLIAAFVSVAVMIAYGDMVGMSSSAYRAIFMFGMKMGAEVLHRTYDMLTALAIAAVCILIEQPLYLYHAGFLLSYGAILGIGCMSDVIKTDMTQVSFNKRRNKTLYESYTFLRIADSITKQMNHLQKSFCASVSIFSIHFPIILLFYYEFPIYSYFLNLLIIPAMGVLLVLGLFCLFLGVISLCFSGLPIAFIFKNMTQVLACLCHVLLLGFEKLCEFSLSLPGATWIVGKPDTWRIIVFYMVILFLFIQHKYNKEKVDSRLCLPFPIKMIMILSAVVLLTQRTYDGLDITILDVGQGDGIFLETQTGHHYLIDGGSTSKNKIGEYTLLPFLKYMGTEQIDSVLLTHLDQDHISGVMELLEDDNGIKIKQVVVAKAALQDEAYAQLVQECGTYGVKIKHVAAGDRLQDGKVSLEILHPSAMYEAADRNAYSLVMKLEYEGFHALFTGDVEADGESVVYETLPGDWNCHLYKAAHHGSAYSNTTQLLEKIKPQLTVISCGEKNSYGHPHPETMERLEQVESEVLVTKDTGAIMIKIQNGKMKIRTYLDEGNMGLP